MKKSLRSMAVVAGLVVALGGGVGSGPAAAQTEARCKPSQGRLYCPPLKPPPVDENGCYPYPCPPGQYCPAVMICPGLPA